MKVTWKISLLYIVEKKIYIYVYIIIRKKILILLINEQWSAWVSCNLKRIMIATDILIIISTIN